MDGVTERLWELQTDDVEKAKQYATAVRKDADTEDIIEKENVVVVLSEYFRSYHEIREDSDERKSISSNARYEWRGDEFDFEFHCRTVSDTIKRKVEDQLNNSPSHKRGKENPRAEQTSDSNNGGGIVSSIKSVWNR